MELAQISPSWPNALRWFLVQNLNSFTPWHFIKNPSDCEFAANAFRREALGGGDVFVFARRQDCDDFAAIEIVDGKFSDRVIYFHPSFTSDIAAQRESKWNIVCDTYSDVFDFVARQVIPDMKDWALTEDASDL